MKSKFIIPPIPAVLLAIVSVQCGAAIAKGLFPEIGAAATASLRIGLSAIILLLTFRPKLSELNAKQWKYVILYGLSLGAMNMVFYFAIERIPIGLGVTLEFVGPLVLAIFSSKKAVDFIWVILAAVGIALIAPWTDKGLDLIGVLLALLAGAFWAAYILLGGRISKIMKGGEAVAVGMLFATILILPFGFAGGGLNHLNPKLLALGAALALLSSAIPFTLEITALKQLPPRTFSILMSLEPAMASLAAFVFLQEYLTVVECAAVACVVIASAGSSLTAKKKAKI
ncbi:transporter [Pedobacter sp. Leaf41]|uniref:EamA family transporter n=1 Tax=Pedobacter sp. Leaf41 TaxID=1736218 RepID=UPI000702B551|nr:DMT family transporter [Pedobacter sp. Leaf41]KQN34594.1 transporter [Pedobacter sp. Leaf41]